ncbi:MAG: hypothetical protein JWP34_4495 [Massilia sp.]|nr:hypothetical protein [Massilia sp.]
MTESDWHCHCSQKEFRAGDQHGRQERHWTTGDPSARCRLHSSLRKCSIPLGSTACITGYRSPGNALIVVIDAVPSESSLSTLPASGEWTSQAGVWSCFYFKGPVGPLQRACIVKRSGSESAPVRLGSWNVANAFILITARPAAVQRGCRLLLARPCYNPAWLAIYTYMYQHIRQFVPRGACVAVCRGPRSYKFGACMHSWRLELPTTDIPGRYWQSL